VKTLRLRNLFSVYLLKNEDMDYYQLINSRESIRNYDPSRQVPEDIMTRILDAGRLAPSACNYQPWKFLVISSSQMLEKVKLCYPRDWFRDAPHILVLVGYKDQAWKRKYDGYNSIETDLAIAMTHIILAAENEGIGACWVEAYNPFMLREALDLADNCVVFGITPLGYQRVGFRKAMIKNRKKLSDIVEYL
jgi:nitroreductase